jgi:RNA methyltransferase, TrmH family
MEESMIQSITSKENAAVKRVVKLIGSSKYRREQNAFVVEGARLCMDALTSGIILEEFFYTEQAEEKYPSSVEALRGQAKKTILVSQAVMAHFTDTKTPQGVLCVCSMLDKNSSTYKMDSSNRLLALEDLQDPSNLGTVLRTAEALGVGGILMNRGCCDIYSPKVLRGSMGAVFRLPFLILEDLPGYLTQQKENGYSIYAAVPDRAATPITKIPFSGHCIVAVGNEGNGLTEACIQACTQSVTIPMEGRAESLNAATAASILIWEMVRSQNAER